jgi:DNA-binding response OmpR family regulator
MKAAAYVVGPLDGPGAALMDMARRLNFATVLPYAGVAQAEQQVSRTPVCYFLFAAVPDVAVLGSVAEAIRFCPSRRVRFSPLIYFSESPSTETITRCINMGFDDVITMPFTRQRVAERIDRQVGQSHIYYETPGYFGPDRRGRVTGPRRAAESRADGQFRRLEIVRSLMTGVNVVRDDFHMARTG